MKHAFHCCVTAAATLLAGAAAAHHSDSLYFIDDRSADGGAIRIEGTISRVRWINPHSEFFVDVPSATGGEPAVWAIETDSVNQLRGLGYLWLRVRSDGVGDRRLRWRSFHTSRRCSCEQHREMEWRKLVGTGNGYWPIK